MKSYIYITLTTVIFFYGCAKEINNPAPEQPKPPSVVTLSATNITCDSVVLNGEVLSDNDSEIISRGLYWSKLPDPGSGDSLVDCTKGTGIFNATLRGLNDSVTYFYRAFATNAAGTSTGEEKSFTTLDKKVPFSGRLVSNSGCLHDKAGNGIKLYDSLSCAQYSFDAASHILRITHFNAAFNCCDLSISSEITMRNDTIIIREVEGLPLCNCLCLFNLEFEIAGVNPQEYVIKFIEPYCMDHDFLVFPVELSGTPSGTECVVRHFGPWY